MLSMAQSYNARFRPILIASLQSSHAYMQYALITNSDPCWTFFSIFVCKPVGHQLPLLDAHAAKMCVCRSLRSQDDTQTTTKKKVYQNWILARNPDYWMLWAAVFLFECVWFGLVYFAWCCIAVYMFVFECISENLSSSTHNKILKLWQHRELQRSKECSDCKVHIAYTHTHEHGHT